MLPGKTYSPEEITRIVLARAWWIIIPLVIGTMGTVVVSRFLPNKYRSETLIMLVPQRVPDSYVKTTVTDKIEDRLATLSDQILSRSRLERIILDLNLYPAQRADLPMEDVVQMMRGDISVKTEGKESFRISYVSRDAKTAQKTTDRLASLFIEENLRDRENMAEDTNQFLDSQLEDARRRLIEHEKKLEEYRRRYSGELPSQASSNLQAIQNAQIQLQAVGETTDRARERRLVLERQIVELEAAGALTATPMPAASTSPDAVAGLSTAQQLEVARARLQMLLARDKPDHPDVRTMQRTIRDLEGKLQAEQKQAGQPAVAEKVLTPAERAQEQRLRDLKAEIAEIDRQIADKQAQDKQLRAVIANYQAKLDVVPTRESDLVELTRDYTTLQTTYQSLLAKREESKIAANLERRNIGEQFKVLDPAKVPERPFSPNRYLIDLGGAGGGLALGLLMVALLEYRDSSFRSEEEIVRVLKLPVLALVPVITARDQVRRHGRGGSCL